MVRKFNRSFNSTSIGDKPRWEGNHSTVVEKLALKHNFSTYHRYFNLKQGEGLHLTLFMYRHEYKPYHMDYCFASVDSIEKLSGVQLGSYSDGTKLSDHKPLIVEFDMKWQKRKKASPNMERPYNF